MEPGRTLLLVRQEPVTEDNLHIWLAKADGSELRRLHPTATRGEHAPVFSPDGKKIAFVTGPHGHERVYVSALDGSSERDLTPADTWADHPTWSPDSTEIAFHAVSYTDGTRQIYIADITGAAARRLPGSTDDFQPVWSPAY